MPEHREKVLPLSDAEAHLRHFHTYVAKSVPKSKWDSTPGMREAVYKEWAKLRAADGGRGTWDESCVRSYWDVQREAKQKQAETGEHTHFGFVFDIGVVKHSELDASKHKPKGRVVFGGHAVRDEHGLEAQFADQGSSASFLAAAKLADGVSLLPGCAGQQSDAVSAYTQAKLGAGMRGGTVCTWVELPYEQWPQQWHDWGWKKHQTPCCPLRLALYGHPKSGFFGEKHCVERLKQCGFVPMVGWECLYFHEKLKLILSVYVDDFKLVGKEENLKEGWKLMINSGLQLDPPEPLGDYLGCGQFPVHVLRAGGTEAP